MNERENNLNEDIVEPSAQGELDKDVLTGTTLEGVAAAIEDLHLTDTKRVYNTINKSLDKGVSIDVETMEPGD